MHHLISTISLIFLSPVNWIILLIITAYFSRKKLIKNICRILALFIFLVFSNGWLLEVYAKKWQGKSIDINTEKVYSCGIIPGGFASPDVNADGYFNAAADRFIQAVKLFKLGKINHILICGGNGKINKNDFREGQWVKNELKVMGIPDSVIIAEDRSNDTFDNAMYSKQILDSLQLKPPYLLITSAHHMPRALLLFNKASVPVYPFPCNYIAGRSSFSFSSLIPNLQVLLGWDIYLKETAGFIWYKIKSD